MATQEQPPVYRVGTSLPPYTRAILEGCISLLELLDPDDQQIVISKLLETYPCV